jgi:hypothetical protein
VEVNLHDFGGPDQSKAVPYGVYKLSHNCGWVSVGADHDTADCAIESIRCWWGQMGQSAYPEATRLLITADAGSSHGYPLHLWKFGLQNLADELGLPLSVCHSLREPACGTRLNTGCLVTLLTTGRASPWSVTKQWST